MYGSLVKIVSAVIQIALTVLPFEGCILVIFGRTEFIFGRDVPTFPRYRLVFKARVYAKNSIFAKKTKARNWSCRPPVSARNVCTGIGSKIAVLYFNSCPTHQSKREKKIVDIGRGMDKIRQCKR